MIQFFTGRQPLPCRWNAKHLVLPSMCLVIACLGCRNETVTNWDEFRPTETVEGRNESVDFNQAVNFLHELEQYDPSQIQRKILFHLQKWVEKQQPDTDWIADPLYQRLPEKYQRIASTESLSRLHFVHYDTVMLQETVWLRDIARTVLQGEQRDEDGWAVWFEKLAMESGVEHAEQLAEIYRLFDWTVRNIQLDADEGNAGADDSSLDPHTAAAARYYVWESLLLGRSPLLTKYRIFLLLARQVDTPVVILSLDSKADRERGRWLAAALVENQLYLFDMQLGLPIPLPNGTGISTLAQIHETVDQDGPYAPQGLGDRYSFDREDLRGSTVLIDGSPAYLAQRMKVVEKRLTGDQKMVLTAQPTPLARQLRKHKGISSVQLWELPYACFLYRSRAAKNPDAMKQLVRRHRLFEGLTPLVQARQLHFRGVYTENARGVSAKSYYLRCRIPDAQIQRLNQERVEQMMGLKKGALDEDTIRERIIKEAKETTRELKSNATYWLGVLALEEAKYNVAISFLQKRILEKYPDSSWKHGATYNLARAFEARGSSDRRREDFIRARDTYLLDAGSPQRYGNQLRAKRLEVLLEDEAFPPARMDGEE